MTDKAFKKFAQEDGCWWTQERDVAERAWNACSEHYEAVMRRALVELYEDCCKNYRSMGIPMAAEDYMDRVLKRAREEGCS